MVRIYEFKWALRLIGITLTTTYLIRITDIKIFRISEIAIHAFFLSITIVTCWLIHAHFITKPLQFSSLIIKNSVSILSAIAASLIIFYLFVFFFPDNRLIVDRYAASSTGNFFIRMVVCFYFSVVCFAVLHNVFVSNNLKNLKNEHEQAKQEHLRAQLSLLQIQISPHFLFNSLNTLKSLTQEQEAKLYIIQMAKVYRHLLKFKEEHLTPLKNEVDFLKSYLHILHSRFEGSIFVKIAIDHSAFEFGIPPLSLQLLVENAIKHNVFSQEHPLSISIDSPRSDSIRVVNSFAPKEEKPAGMGFGLKNLNQRYMILTKKPITIERDKTHFSVTLPLYVL